MEHSRAGASAVRRLGNVQSFFVIGDSQVLMFRDRVFTAHGRVIVPQVKYVPALHARDFSDSEQRLHPTLLAQLVGENFLHRDGAGWTAMPSSSPLSRRRELGVRGLHGQPFVFVVGGLDAISCSTLFGGVFEIEPSADMARLPASARTSRIVRFERAYELAGKFLQPYERGLRLLSNMGLENLFVHATFPVAAPASGIEARREAAAVGIDRRTVQWCSILFNYWLRQMAQRLGVGWIDTFEHLVDADNYRDPRYSHDQLHCNLAAATFTIEELIAQGALRVNEGPSSSASSF